MSADNVNYLLPTEGKFFASYKTPPMITHIQDALLPDIEQVAKDIAATEAPNLHFVGCACGLSAGLDAKYILDRFSTIRSDVYTGYQFLSRSPLILDENSFVFLMSLSGETPETLEAKKLAMERGANCIVITETKESPLAAEEPVVPVVLNYHTQAGVYTAPLTVLYLLSAHIMKARSESVDTAEEILSEMKLVPERMEKLAETTFEQGRELAEQFNDVELFYVLGTGVLFGLAFKIAKSVITENLWLDACEIDAAEFYHGPMEIVPPKPPERQKRAFLHLLGTEKVSRIPSKQALAFLTKAGARQLVFDAKDYPEFGELFAPYALFAPTEWFIMHMAAQMGHHVDDRRWMGKIGASWGEYGDL